jgi:hypothetical protein
MDSRINQVIPASLLAASASAAAAIQIGDQAASNEPSEQLSQVRNIADDVIAGLSKTTRLADTNANASAGLHLLAWLLQDFLERLLTGKPATTPRPSGPKATAATASDTTGGQSQSAPIAKESLGDNEGTALLQMLRPPSPERVAQEKLDALDDLLELLSDVKRVDSRGNKSRTNKARAADGRRDSKPSDTDTGSLSPENADKPVSDTGQGAVPLTVDENSGRASP